MALKEKGKELFKCLLPKMNIVGAKIKRWRWVLISGILSALLCFAFMVMLFSRNYAIGVLKSKFDDLEKNLQSMGYDYAYDDLRFYSFSPWQIMRVKNFRIYSLDDKDFWQWQSDELDLDVGLWNMDKVDVYIGRQQTFTHGDKKWFVQLDKSSMQFRLKYGALKEILFRADNMIVKDLFALETLYAQVKYQNQPYMIAKFDAKGGQIAPQVNWSLNRQLDHFYTNVSMNGTWDNEVLFSEAFYDWVEKGGNLSVHKVILNWKPLIVVGNGDILFDEDGDPTALLNTASLALPETIEKLNAEGFISNKTAFVLKILLNNKAIQQNETDQYKTVVSPLKISKDAIVLENIKIK